MPRQVVFPGLSDAEVLSLVNQHRPGFAGDSLSEEALQMHEEAVLSGDDTKMLSSLSERSERSERATAAMARSLMTRRSPSPADDSPLTGGRFSRVSSTGGEVASEASDPLPDLLQLGVGARRRILERQASGMHHSQAFELEGLTATGGSSLVSRLAQRLPSPKGALQAAGSDSSKPSRFALRRAGTSPPRSEGRRVSSGSALAVAEASRSTADPRARRSSGSSACSGNSACSGDYGRSIAAAAGAASFAFAMRKARNAQDVVRRAGLPSDRATDQSVQSVGEMRQEARERAEKMQEKKYRYESRHTLKEPSLREPSLQEASLREVSLREASLREASVGLDSRAVDKRFERLMQRMEQLELTVSQGVQRMEGALLSPRSVAAAHTVHSGHAAQVAQARNAANGEGFKAIAIMEATGSKSPSPTPSGPPPIPPRRSSRSPRFSDPGDPESPGATRSLPASPYRGKPRRSFSVESTATSCEVSAVPAAVGPAVSFGIAAVPSSNSPGSGEGSPLGLLQRGSDPDAEASPRASPLRRVLPGNREGSWSSLSHACSGD